MSEELDKKQTATDSLEKLQQNPWVGLLGGLGITALTLFGIWAGWLGSFSGPELSYGVSKGQSLQGFSSVRWNLKAGAVELADPFVTEVSFENIGLKPLEVGAFTDTFPPKGSGLLLKTQNVSCQILECDASWINSHDRQPLELTKLNPSEILIKPLSLNTHEGFKLKILSNGNLEPIVLTGHILNGKIQQTQPGNWSNQFHNILNGFLFVGALLGFVSFALHFYWYYALQALVKWLVEMGLKGALKVLGLFGTSSLSAKVAARAKTPERAREILTSATEFDQLAEDVAATTAEEKDTLRKLLAEIATEVGATDHEPQSKTADSNKPLEDNAEHDETRVEGERSSTPGIQHENE